MRICIDPGHGGKDPGAINSQTTEKDMNLAVGLEVKRLLTLNGFDVKLTRETDVFLDLTDRCNISNQFKADYFISVHHNAGGGDGYEVIHSIHHGKGVDLANYLAQEFRAIGQNPHGVAVYDKASTKYPGHDYFTVIENTHAPAIISEFCYVDSKDFTIADTVQELLAEAQAIAKAVCDECEVIFVSDQERAPQDWREQAYQELAEAGLKFDEKRFDEPMTRGEAFAMLNKFRKIFLSNK